MEQYIEIRDANMAIGHLLIVRRGKQNVCIEIERKVSILQEKKRNGTQ